MAMAIATMAVAQCRSLSASDPVRPGVFSYAVGISKHEDNALSLPRAADDAKHFAAACAKAFGHASEPLLDEKATLSNLRKILFEEIPQLPPRSVVLLYYGGHGFRSEYSGSKAGKVAHSDLWLQLHNASNGDIFKSSITLDELLSGFKRAPIALAFIFLDVCRAKDEPSVLEAHEREFQDLGIKVSVFVGCGTNEQARDGVFWDALSELWADPELRYANPAQVGSELQRKVLDRNKNMTAGLAFGGYNNVGMGNLSEPITFLSVHFSSYPRNEGRVYINGAPTPILVSTEDPGVHLQVPRKDFVFCVHRQGNGEPMGKPLNVTGSQLSEDWATIPFDFSDRYTGDLTSGGQDAHWAATFAVASSVGVPDEQIRSKFISRLTDLARKPDDAPRATALLGVGYSMGIWGQQDGLSLVKDLCSRPRGAGIGWSALDVLEAKGAHDLAAEVGYTLASGRLTPEERGFALYRCVVNAKVSRQGRLLILKDLKTLGARIGLPDQKMQEIISAYEAKPDDLRKHGALQKTFEDWQKK
jgi:hypothetical protein